MPRNARNGITMFEKIGSSETTREILITQQNNFMDLQETTSFSFKPYIESYAPQHKGNNVDTTFLEWLVGFFEAEGCFLKWKNSNDQDRFGIEIIQKDVKLIYKIKKELGFGNVTEITKKESGKIYWRYYAQNLEALMRWIALLNGNLITEKRQAGFKSWLVDINKSKNKAIPLLPNTAKISLENAWLSGFFEGDAGFWVRKKVTRANKKDGANRYDIKARFYLTQKEEKSLLNQIKKLLKIPTKIHIITNGRTKVPYNRIETSRLDCHLIVIQYLTRYRFKGKRYISFCIWERICAYRTKEYPITEKSIVKLKRLVKMLQKHQDDEDKENK